MPARRLPRRSLSYFAQLSDFQLADEESPARVVVGGGFTRVGYAGSYRRSLPASTRRRVSGRAILAITSSNAYAVRGGRVGSSERKLRRRFRGERRFRVGRSRWYLVRGRRARVTLRVRRGKVREIGLGNAGLTSGRAGARRFLRAF